LSWPHTIKTSVRIIRGIIIELGYLTRYVARS